MNNFILSFALLPLIAFIISLLINGKKERFISQFAFIAVILQLLNVSVFILIWLITDSSNLNIKELVLFKSNDYEFLIDFYFDKVTAVFLFVGSLITLIIVKYSRYYMHLEQGYKRFFNSILFFYFSYNFTVLSGNFETLFMGWEMLGISSFILIAFYRDRYLPVKNAVRVFSIYRIGDVGILIAAWASHHLWHENITFFKLNNYDLVHHQLLSHTGIGFLISISILLAAAAKSAQLPFSSWLPRAMEGPTPSSAIFYGALSVHFGVFLLLRTFHFWEHQFSVRIIIGVLGFFTAIVSYYIAKVQSTIKTQIAYFSISQIGIMFIELALGLESLVLLHFFGNAFLRAYQLLISPSVVSYIIKDQFYNFKKTDIKHQSKFKKQIHHSLYLLALKEWNLDGFINRWAFGPVKKMGRLLSFLSLKNIFWFFVPFYLFCTYVYFIQKSLVNDFSAYLPELFSFLGLILVFRAFVERKFPRLAWLLIILNHFWIALAVSFNEKFDFKQTFFYLFGVILSGVIGYVCLEMLRKKEQKHFDLNQYYGHIYEYPKLAFVFFLSTLGLMGFPITTTFIGEDLIFSHIHENQYLLAFFYSLSFIISGIVVIRIYARLFLGPHIKHYHNTPLKST